MSEKLVYVGETARLLAHDYLMGSPGVAPNPRRAVYVDRWRLAVANGLDGPFDARLGSIVSREG